MAGGEEDENMTALDQAGGESSDDDIEIVPKSVDNYWLEQGDETPSSFATLPYFKLGEDILPDKVVYVRGTQDNGMRLYMRAMLWKLELSKDIKPVFHLKTEKYWIQLLKPRKSYEETIRSIMSVAQFLNFALVNPDASEKSVWSHVKDVFPSWEVSPSRTDLSSHLPVVQHIVASDEHLAAASALQTLDIGVSKKRLASATEDGRQSSRKGMYVSDEEGDGGAEGEGVHEQKRGKFELEDLNSGEEMDGYGEETDLEEAGDLSETVCCICDNGGTVTCCDGPCMRSFHLNKGAGGADDSHCSTLGFSKAEAERTDKFFCPNCKSKQHQCYACGKLGCSDEAAGDSQEVFVCDAAMCGHFYHPTCVAALILRDKDSSEQDALAESIKERKGFVCTMHKCWKCGKGEDKNDKDLQFGICRRCPRVWHRKCLPFPLPNDDSESEDDEPQRAWDDLLPNRILVYCKRHMIITKLGTPARNHVKFPEGFLPFAKKVLVKSRAGEQERKSKLLKLLSKKDAVKLKSGVGQKDLKFDHVKKPKQTSTIGQGRLVTKSKLVRDSSASGVVTAKASEKSSGPFLIKGRSDMLKQDYSLLEDSQKPSKPLSVSKVRVDTDGKLESSSSMVSKSSTPREFALQQKTKLPIPKAIVIDSQTKSMVTDIIERNKAFVTIESVLKKQDIPACYRRHTKTPDKKYSLFKIESITKGMRKALETLETGGTTEDAKAKCSPDLIRFIELCRNDLRVYLSPFLHGARYTSYGRHFTKSEKLEEIVDRLHWYIEPGDMLVDFCCGANEFSLFTRRKLEETGKKCEYKNFDLIQTKNDFNFSKRDWFQVSTNEMPDGSRLIMGLNPPFGVKGHLANQFIDHALKFKPKLIVLIVPKETERLDRKRDMYDLVWEDSDLLSGMSFYLPGSVDKDQKPLNDWNVVPPPLYVWSRPDWTSRHRQIASDKGHISAISSSRFVGSPWKPRPRPSSPSSLLDLGVDSDEDSMAPGDLEDKEEVNKSYKTLVENRIEGMPTDVQETGPKLERSSSAKLKEQKTKSREPSDFRIGDSSRSKSDARVQDKVLDDAKVKASRKDVSVVENQVEGRRLESQEKISESSQANQKNMKTAKAGELPKRKSSEGHTQRMDKLKPSSQESPEVTRRNSETRHDTYRKERMSNDRYDRGDDPRTEPTRDVHWKRAPEKIRPSGDPDTGGRRSPNWHDTYESGRRNSPDKYDRYGISRHGEDRKVSPERSRRSTMVNEPRKRSPDKSRYGSSVVDLEMFSSSDAKIDQSRGYDDHARKSTAEDYKDSSFYRGGSPTRRHVTEDSNRTWVNMDSYQGASEKHQRTTDTGFMTNNYDGMASYRAQHAEAQLNSLVVPYPDREGFGGRRQDAYGVQVSRHADLYQPDLSRGVPGLSSVNYRDDRYGVPMRTDDHFRASAPGGVGVLPERSFHTPWPGTTPAPLVYNSAFGAQVPQQTIVDPSLLASHGLFDDRLNQHNRPQYPGQGRLSGQGNRQFSGGWFDD